MSKMLVWHNHELIGEHDARCEELVEGRDNTYHRRHEGNALIVHEDGRETRYEAADWSVAGVDAACGYMESHGIRDCPRCKP